MLRISLSVELRKWEKVNAFYGKKTCSVCFGNERLNIRIIHKYLIVKLKEKSYHKATFPS